MKHQAVNRISETTAQIWAWLRTKQMAVRNRSHRELRLQEILSLGERGFIAVIEAREGRFLVGGTRGAFALLSSLPAKSQTAESWAKPETMPVYYFQSTDGPYPQLAPCGQEP